MEGEKKSKENVKLKVIPQTRNVTVLDPSTLDLYLKNTHDKEIF